MNKLKTSDKLTIQLWLGVILALVGIALIWTGLFIAPLGEIHPSVLTAVGECLTFSGALIGVDYNYRYKQFKIRYESKDTDEENC